MALLLWVDEILHHLRNARMIRFPCKYQQTLWLPIVSTWCELDSVHHRTTPTWAALRSPATSLTFNGLNGNYH